jgi:hypothetical protein
MNLGDDDDAVFESIAQEGPRGALTIAGCATAIVVLLWFAFYMFIFIPRGVIQ